jgi:hypothetical protein
MNFFTIIYNFLFRVKIVDDKPALPFDNVMQDTPIERIKAPEQKRMSWDDARILIMGEKMDSLKDN